jgi:hypothetical protein
MALLAGVEPAVRLHLSLGHELNSRDHLGHTPLMIAASANRVAICELLLAAGADPTLTDNSGQDALSIAQDADADGARMVVERGINAAARSRAGPLIKNPANHEDGVSDTGTVEPRSDAVIDSWIAQLGSSISTAENRVPRKTPPHCFPITQTALRARLASGEDIDVRDGDGRTALMVAACLDKAKMCRLLIEAGANPALRNAVGQDVLAIAKAHGADAARREIERALSLTHLATEPEPLPIAPIRVPPEPLSLDDLSGEDLFDFGAWEAEPDTTAPKTDDDLLARATEIQRAISTHAPKDDAQRWDDLDLSPQYQDLDSGNEGAHSIEPSGLDDVSAEAWDTHRARAWEAIRQRNEETAKRKRSGLAPIRAKPPLATQELSMPSDSTVHAKTAMSTAVSRPFPTPSISGQKAIPAMGHSPLGMSTPLPQEKPMTLKMVLAEAKRAGFHVQVDGDSVSVDIHAANDSKSRKIIRQLTDFGFEHRPMVGYCK